MNVVDLALNIVSIILLWLVFGAHVINMYSIYTNDWTHSDPSADHSPARVFIDVVLWPRYLYRKLRKK